MRPQMLPSVATGATAPDSAVPASSACRLCALPAQTESLADLDPMMPCLHEEDVACQRVVSPEAVWEGHGSPAALGRPVGGLYVRWKRRRLRRRAEMAWDAVVVRSVWHQGAARQHVVAYLASIRAAYHTAPAHQAWFWSRVDARLGTLELDPATREAVETRLARLVPRPTVEALQAVATQQDMLTRWADATVSPSALPRAHGLAMWPNDRHEAPAREGGEP